MVKKYRTDLAIEEKEIYEGNNVEIPGVSLTEEKIGDVLITSMNIFDKLGASLMKKPCGNYITIESENIFLENKEIVISKIGEIVNRLLKNNTKKILVVGLGNREATPDALGPLVVKNIFPNESLCCFEPSVFGKTGMETADMIKGIVKEVKPCAVIFVDALAARKTNRLAKTIQITDTGIIPGSGVGNNRKELNEQNMGVPVIAIGAPTVVDIFTIVSDFVEMTGKNDYFCEHNENMYVTPKDIDEQVFELSLIISEGINKSL